MVESHPRFHAAPAHSPSVALHGQQPGAHTLGRDSRALGRDLLLGRTGQVAHHLPADRGVGIEQPLRHRSVRRRPLVFSWIHDPLPVLVLPQCETTAGPCPSDAQCSTGIGLGHPAARIGILFRLVASLAPSSGRYWPVRPSMRSRMRSA